MRDRAGPVFLVFEITDAAVLVYVQLRDAESGVRLALKRLTVMRRGPLPMSQLVAGDGK